MSFYHTQLPGAFPYVTILTAEQVKEAVTALMDSERKDVPLEGSNFAVTVDWTTQNFCFWMSELTFRFCYSALLEGMWRPKGPNLEWPQLMSSKDFVKQRLEL